MDYYRTLTILRVNGLTEGSSPEDMTTVLRGAGFTETDIIGFLKAHKDQLANPQAAAGIAGSPGIIDPLRPHLDHVVLYAPPSPFLHQPPPPRSWPVRILRTVIMLLILGGAGYAAFMVYGIPSTTAVLAAMQTATVAEPFHTNMALYPASSTNGLPLSIHISADVDTQSQNSRMSASSTIHSVLADEFVEARVLGDAMYTRGGLDQSSPWRQVNKEQLADPAVSRTLPLGFKALLAVSNPQDSANKLKILFDSGVLTPVGKPSFGLDERHPTIIYKFQVDPNKILPWEQANELSSFALAQNVNSHVTYGPVEITKDFLTGRVKSLMGTITVVTADELTSNHITTVYTYSAAYQPLSSVSVEAPN